MKEIPNGISFYFFPERTDLGSKTVTLAHETSVRYSPQNDLELPPFKPVHNPI